jgi:hypothetical protein
VGIGKTWRSFWCAESPYSSKPVKNVAFVGFDFHGAAKEPTLRQVYYDGRVISADFAAGSINQSIFSLTVLGGTYQSSEPQLGLQNGTSLELFPKCSERVVRLPRLWRTTAGNTDLVASLNGQSCRAKADAAGQFAMSFPSQSQDDTASSLKVTLPASAGGAELGISWKGRLAPQLLLPKALKVRFSWKRHCTYASNSCPDAVLLDQGIACHGTFNAATARVRTLTVSSHRPRLQRTRQRGRTPYNCRH